MASNLNHGLHPSSEAATGPNAPQCATSLGHVLVRFVLALGASSASQILECHALLPLPLVRGAGLVSRLARRRGLSPSHGGMGMDPTWTDLFTVDSMKEHGQYPTVGYGPSKHDLRMNKTSVAKRSYKRAIRRIASHGYCWYRGQCLTKADVSMDSITHVTSSSSPSKIGRVGPRWTAPLPPNRAHVPRHRIVALVWNPGGLSRSKLQEFLHWAECQSTGIFILPETRWAFDSNWEDAKWLFVHSGAGSGRSSGILIIISKQLCTGDLLSHRNLIPGRLVHLRLHLAPRYLDILACYQYAGHTGADMDARASFWNTLDGALHSLAQRHGLTLAGDFNCCLTAGYPITGTNVFTHGGRTVLGTQHRDRAMFNQIAMHHGLVALNCWDASMGPTSTNPIGAVSRIDFVFLRQKFVDARARRAVLLPEAPLPMILGHIILLCCAILLFHGPLRFLTELSCCSSSIDSMDVKHA